ncbi:MAG: beta-ketoacyl synthase chain length factor [Prevotellaceae bacterium]|jgi:hypothetical protein|nr:beta-ketoacyl synthase chain length factor [Prevotellaceae bacterium]
MNVYLLASASINPVTELPDTTLPAAIACGEGNRRIAREPDYKKYILDANIRRRMSRVMKMGVAAAMQCLSQSGRQPGAIITATGLGCLNDTEKFLKNIIENGEHLLNPTPFTQSTFNTIGAQAAIVLKNTNYNTTYVHRGFSFENALLDAMMKIRDGEAAQVLVESYEEQTDTSFKIMERLGFWRHGAVCGEGVQCFILSAQPGAAGKVRLKDVLCVFGGEPQTLKEKLSLFLRKNGLHPGEVDVLLSGKSGRDSRCPYYQMAEEVFHTASVAVYKPFFGDYPTVSSLALWLAARVITQQQLPGWLSDAPPQQINRMVIYNHFNGKNHSFLLVEKEEVEG